MKKEISIKTIMTYAKNWMLITFGLALFAFAWSAFLIPSKLMGGGVSGIASLIYFAVGIPIGLSTFVINITLVLIAFKILGKQFSINTIICTALLSSFFAVFQPIFPQPLVDDTFLCSLIGSMLAGVGVGIALNYGGNTGGTDILVMVINHYRNISYGKLSLAMNIVIIGCSYFIIQSIDCLVYSYVAMFAYGTISDMVLDGYKQTFQIMVFSDKNQEISDTINQQLHRGATLLKGYGSYTKTEKEILLVIAHREDKQRIIKIIKDIDDSAFLSIAKTSGVFGKNFDRLRL